MGSACSVVGWHDDQIVFASNAGQPFSHLFWLYAVDQRGENVQRLPYGPAHNASWGAEGVVIGRNTGDLAHWKRYRGGRAGELWIDERGTGEFRKLIELPGNLADPMWIGSRIYFVSDHDGIGNVFSCLPDGQDLQQHTNQCSFFARNASADVGIDGRQIVYHVGADIHVLDLDTGASRLVEIEHRSPHILRSRKFVLPEYWLEDYELSKDGAYLGLVLRGKTFTLGNWEGPVLQLGIKHGVRYRLTRWLADGKRVVLVSDEGGEDHIEVHHVPHDAADASPCTSYPELDVGRPREIVVSPCKDQILLTNHRQELLWIDLETSEVRQIEQDPYRPLAGFDWSPDGTWVAYSAMADRRVRIIKVFDTLTGEIHPVTEPVLYDTYPVFDPEGKYLYFLSRRIMNPVSDTMQLGWGFPRGMRPYAITLRQDLPSPFVHEPRGFGAMPAQDEKPSESRRAPAQESERTPAEDTAGPQGQPELGIQAEPEPEEEPEQRIAIDWEGIERRVVPFPVGEGIYGGLSAVKGRVFYMTYPIEGAWDKSWNGYEPPAKACLMVYDLTKLQEGVFVDRLTGYTLSGDGSAMLCRVGNRLRVIPTKRDPSQRLPVDDRANRQSGWVDLRRVTVSIEPVSEWRQMLREAWRLQRDYFWVEDMSGVDWERVLERYEPLVERVACRSEFSDLLTEMQGELGTSHAYVLASQRSGPRWSLGYLGADLAYDAEHDAYRLARVLKGDVWDEELCGPLMRPSVNVEAGMLLLAIGGQRLSKDCQPRELLVNQAGQEVQLVVAESDGSSPRTVNIRAARSERPIRYRDWVEHNRQYVHDQTEGRVGYVHIPDMKAHGYAEFHRYFLAELDHDGLIVDVRFNGGGHISDLLLQKLAPRRVACEVSRWRGTIPYPLEAVRGPLVALTNEHTYSDGDIFGHSFKLMKLGPLIGRRTRGGVIGYWPHGSLVDGTLTRQPEGSYWFKDVGWGVENRGTDPDIEVDISPQDYVRGVDAQLDRAIEVILQEVEKDPPLKPSMDMRPRLTLPG
jgi:tricorn protease